jgi:hypothetical protein
MTIEDIGGRTRRLFNSAMAQLREEFRSAKIGYRLMLKDASDELKRTLSSYASIYAPMVSFFVDMKDAVVESTNNLLWQRELARKLKTADPTQLRFLEKAGHGRYTCNGKPVKVIDKRPEIAIPRIFPLSEFSKAVCEELTIRSHIENIAANAVYVRFDDDFVYCQPVQIK